MISLSAKRYGHRTCEETANIREVADSGSRRCLPIRDHIEVDKVVDDVALSACAGAS